MSLDATRWAWQQSIKPAGMKLILLSMADRASNDSGFECYPSTEQLVTDTGLDRKTVLEGLKRLADVGLIIDTGKRVGATKQVKVFKLVGVISRDEDVDLVHFVYMTTDISTSEFYIGVHSTGDVEDKYLGSGKWVSTHENKHNLSRKILAKFTNRKDAYEEETRLIELNINNELCRNKRINSTKNGTVPKTEQYRFSHESIPKTDLNSTVFPMKASQKRDTETITKPTNKPIKETKEKKIDFFSGINQQVVSDYLAVRKARKAPPVSKTVFDGLSREANKAGYTIEQALITCIERNWVGFRAEWVDKKQSYSQSTQPSSYQQSIDACAKAVFKPEYIAEQTRQTIEVNYDQPAITA